MEERNYPWGHSKRYNDFPSYFKQKFSKRVQKVSVDAGFTCPNRDGSKGKGGCTYCNNKSFNPDYCKPDLSVTTQIDQGVSFFSAKYKAQKYLAYFQAYSNTYAPLDTLKKLYLEALAHEDVIGLVIGTRPDCVSAGVLDFLEELARDYYIVIEYGIESCNDKALQYINRGHTWEEALATIQNTAGRGIHVGAHLVMGLPYDDYDSMLQSAVMVSDLPVDTIKLHQLQVLNHTVMAKQYEKEPELFNLFTLEGYIDFVVDVVERMNPRVMLDRFINQAPPGWLIEPKWGVKNFEFVAKLEKRLRERNTWQGRLYCER
jgi:radical SAM protein (TIGR01212 family)